MRQIVVLVLLAAIALLALAAPALAQSAAEAGHEQPATSWVLLAALMGLAMILTAFFAGSETALVSVDRIRIGQLVTAGNTRAKIVQQLVSTPDRMLGMTLVGTNLMHVLASEFGLIMWIVILQVPGPVRTLVVGRLGLEAEAIAIVVTSILILIFGEILPKTVSRIRADHVSVRYAPLMRLFDLVLLPIVAVITAVTNRLAQMVGRGLSHDEPGVERDELRLLATMGEQTGGLPSTQRQMIHGVLDLRMRTVQRVMVPLVHVRALRATTTVEAFHRAAARHGHARFPVFQGRIDNVIGIVHLLDIIYAEEPGSLPADTTIERFVRADVSYVPESKNIYELLDEIRRSHMTMAMVVDEYGGVVGLVTVEDVLEEIIGEFADERDIATRVRVVAPRVFECDGRTEMDELRERYRLALPSGDYETIAGLVLHERGRVPRSGDTVTVGHYIITVLEADHRTIRSVRISTN